MSKSIDYEAYLKQINLTEINNTQQDCIKKYLEKQCETDEALKAVYNPEKVQDCYNFIFECAKKVAKGNNSVLEDAVVFKMARDYFIEILPTLKDDAEEKSVDITPVQEIVKEVSEQIEEDAKKDDVVRDAHGFEIFGEDPEPEEAAQEPCNQEEVEEQPEEKPVIQYAMLDVHETTKTDEDGNRLLFDF